MEVFLASHESILALLYMLGIAVWMGLWYVADSYRLTQISQFLASAP